MNALDQITLFIVSLVANLFSAFSGGGAGLIQLPVLIFMGLPFTIALATHKVASVALGIGATVRHLREQPLERRLALYILASGLPGVIVGANFIIDVPERTAEVALGILTVAFYLGSWTPHIWYHRFISIPEPFGVLEHMRFFNGIGDPTSPRWIFYHTTGLLP